MWIFILNLNVQEITQMCVYVYNTNLRNHTESMYRFVVV